MEYNLENLLEKIQDLDDLNNEEVEFLNKSFKNELRKLLDKYNCEIGLDIEENKIGERNVILTSEIAHYKGMVLISGNLEFNNIKSSSL